MIQTEITANQSPNQIECEVMMSPTIIVLFVYCYYCSCGSVGIDKRLSFFSKWYLLLISIAESIIGRRNPKNQGRKIIVGAKNVSCQYWVIFHFFPALIWIWIWMIYVCCCCCYSRESQYKFQCYWSWIACNLHVCCHRCHQICVLSPASSTAQQHVIWLENDQMSICQRQCLNNNNNMILTTTVRFSFRFVLLSPRNHCNYNCCRCCYFHALVIQIQWKSNERKERASQS